MTRRLSSPAALAALLGGEESSVDHRKVVEWTRRYGWPHVRIGRTIAFTDDDVAQIVAAHHVAGSRGHHSDALPGQTALSAARSA